MGLWPIAPAFRIHPNIVSWLCVVSAEIGSLEATRLQHESTIKDLQGQVNQMKDRIKFLEGAKQVLEDKGKVQQSEQVGAVKSMEKVCIIQN